MKTLVALLFLLPRVLKAATTFQPLGASFKFPVATFQGFSAHVAFSNLTAPRGIVFDANQNLLVVERGFGVTAFTQVTSPAAGWNRTVVIESQDFTQGIQIDGRNLYISTGTAVWVYQYDIATKSVGTTPPFTLLETDSTGRTTAVLVATAPLEDPDPLARDPSTGRSTIRRYPVPAPSSSGYHFSDGQTVAYGIRNPTGFAFNPNGPGGNKDLLVVDNAAELSANITKFSTVFSASNPADEMQRVQYAVASDGTIPPPRFYGFPDCATVWNPQADPSNVPSFLGTHKGTQFSVGLNQTRDDAWCSNKTNNVPPVLSFEAHTSPLDIKFYNPSLVESNASFPGIFEGDAFVSFHGSFGQTVPTGYGVVQCVFYSIIDDTKRSSISAAYRSWRVKPP
ncbi:hypothetical protein DXG01_007611 [Tephrocybe rancida]|nr:hypothetical protein DXG01_007611 [Tephrocybe rancida]